MTDPVLSAAGRYGAHLSWARTEDRAARTAAARAAAEKRFEREVDPDGVLDPQERAIRAEHARKAFYQRLALRSAQKRRRRQRTAATAGDAPEAAAPVSGATT